MGLPELSLTSWAGIAATAALIGGAWYRIQSAIRYVTNVVLCRATIQDEAARAVMSFAWERGRKSPFSVRLFAGVRSFLRPKKKVEVIAYEQVSNEPMVFLFGRVPVVVQMAGGKDGQSSVTLMFLRGTLDLDTFIEQALVAYNQLTSGQNQEKPRRRFNVHRVSRSNGGEKGGLLPMRGGYDEPNIKLSGYASASPVDPSDIIKRIQHKEVRLITWQPEDLIELTQDQPPFDVYPFTAEQLSILPSIERWLKAEGWYRSKGIPHRMGFLCHGLPGGGKSTFVRSIAIKFDLPIYVFDLASLDNKAFIDEWKNAQANAPAIVLLEDLDNVYVMREFVAKVAQNRDTLTFDCLLNTISGVGSSDGILLFVTTNDISKLDPALGIQDNGFARSTRPGRLDRVIHFGPMEEEQRRKLAAFILDAWPDQVERIVAEGEGETVAQFQFRCSQFAEKMFWERGGVVAEPVKHEPPKPKWNLDVVTDLIAGSPDRTLIS